MNLANGPIKRPILTLMIYLIIIVTGLVSAARLSIDLMPEITWPTITVSTSYGNVGPEEMEQLISRPIEESVAAIQGVEEITSTSTEGQSSVRVAFGWDKDLEEAANDIRERIDRVIGQLPEDIERPRILKFDLSSFPVLFIGATGKMNPVELRKIIDDQIKYRIERLPGVASAEIWGGLNREIHVWLHSDQVKSLGLSTNEILNALRRENDNIPAGTYKTGNYEVLIRTQGEFQNLDEICQTVVAVRNGAPIRVQDFATVSDSWEEVTRIVRVNGEPSIRLAIRKQSGANTVDVVDNVMKELDAIRRDIPHVQLTILRDTSKYIENSISNVGRATLLGGVLAVLILFLFLRNLSSTAVIATAIPVSIIATFGLIYFGGFTLNLMTFGGLALGIGMLLDSSIVVLENIFRQREHGLDPVPAALLGSKEVTSAIIASTTTTLVVFLPVVFMRGISGIYFQQLAYVVAFSLLCSLFVALTLVPMLSARFLKRKPGSGSGRIPVLAKIYATSERSFGKIEAAYEHIIEWALSHKRSIIFGAVAIFALSIFMINFIGTEFLPPSDEGEVRVNVEMDVGTRLEVVDQLMLQIEKIIMEEVPEMEVVQMSAGAGGWSARGGHTGRARITLKPLEERNRSSEEVANALRQKLNSLPGAKIRVSASQGFWLLRMGQSSDDAISVEVRGYDLEIARSLAHRVREMMDDIPSVTDTRISREEGRPEQIVRIDRQKAADLGLSVTAIGEAMRTAIGGSYASWYRDAGKQYRILVRFDEEDRQNLRKLMDMTITNSRGQQVVLRNVVDIQQVEGPVRIERKDQERTVYVYGNITGRPMGVAVADIREELRNIPTPRDFSILIGGDYEEQQKAFRELFVGLILAIVLVYIVMAGQFESFKHPLVVLFSVPMAVIGVVMTMIATGTSFSMNAYIGCIMLGGIIVNNAILLVDYTNLLRRRDNMELYEAVKLAGRRRLRPILMTTMTTMLGLLPLAIGFGEGGETQAPLARVVIGGLASSALITLVLIPVVYTLFEGKKVRTAEE